jgi:cytochrome c553
MRRAHAPALAAAALLAAAVAAAAATPEEELIASKCTLCHTKAAVYTADSAKLKETVERMTAKNPAWFKDVEMRHLLEALEKMVADPQVAAARAAWDAAAARGEALFTDPTLGTTGKSCADCHSAASLGRVKDAYPRFNPELGRAESLEERLDTMVRVKLQGAGLPLGDERSTALAIYLKTLR